MARNYKEEWGKVRTQLLNTATITPVKKEDLTFLQILEEDIKKYFTDDSLTSKVKGEIEKVAIATMERTSFQEKYKSDKEKIYNYPDNKEVWDKAIDIFRDRLTKRYFETIDWILEKGEKEEANSKWKGEGFAIVTLQCALIETFAAFQKGEVEKHNDDGYPGWCKQKDFGKTNFIDFLTTHFGDTFTDDITSNPSKFSAEEFYYSVRCGLMHQTRTKGEWLIKVYKSRTTEEQEVTEAIKRLEELNKKLTEAIEKLEESNKEKLTEAITKLKELNKKKPTKAIEEPEESNNESVDDIKKIIKEETKEIINSVNGDGQPPMIAEKITSKNNKPQFHLYRTVLHLRLFGYLMTYCEELKENNQNGEELRRRFARCMDHLFDFKPTYDDNQEKYTAPDWWVEVSQTANVSQQSTTNGSNI